MKIEWDVFSFVDQSFRFRWWWQAGTGYEQLHQTTAQRIYPKVDPILREIKMNNDIYGPLS